MIEELTAGSRNLARPSARATDRLVKWFGRRLLRFEPEGAVLLTLPDGQRIRFGRPGRDAEVTLKLRNYRVLRSVALRGTIGFAEAYIDGDIDSDDLTALFGFFVRNRDRLANSGRGVFKVRLPDRLAHLRRRNSKSGSRRNISDHYDLGNDFFRPWLDADMNYSSGYYAGGAETLEAAQCAKLDVMLDMLELSGGERLLEIGCGWGAFACRAARQTGARVTGITLSREQLHHARLAAVDAGVGAACDFRYQDYRDVEGRFDRIASIEMIEAVGEDYWPRYFAVLNDRLDPGGIAVLQAITIDESRFEHYRRTPDFIQRYIFPGGMLPTPTAIATHAAVAGFRLDRQVRFGACYARTVRTWRERFEAAWPTIAELGFDERFRRRWRYYLAYCEAGFLENVIDVGIYRLRKA
jgi:cyclopropane-fatty-acyl-phospholipid synthase